MKILITVIAIAAVIIIILNLLFGYIYSYGVKTGSSSVLTGPLNEWHQKGGYEFGSLLHTGKDVPEGLVITLSHPTSGRNFDLGLSSSQIMFRVPKNLKHEVIIENIILNHKTSDGKLIKSLNRNDGVNLGQKDFPVNLSTHKTPPSLSWQLTYEERDFTKEMEGYVYIKMSVDGQPKIIEGTFKLERVKAYWKPAVWLSV